jgi:hypothetical protein
MILYGWLLNGHAQSQAGLEQYYYLNFIWQHKKKAPAHNPQNTKQQFNLYQFGNSELLTTTK